MRHIREVIVAWLNNRNPWQLEYRIIELKQWSEYHEKIESKFFIQARLKYLPIWFMYSDNSFNYFCQAYTKMKKLRGIPKTRKYIIPESECILRLMEDEET